MSRYNMPWTKHQYNNNNNNKHNVSHKQQFGGPRTWIPNHVSPQTITGWQQKPFPINRNSKQPNNRGRPFRSQHDDRIPDTTRRVSFMSKNRISKHTSRKRDADGPVRGRLNDDDVEMAGAAFLATKGSRYKTFGPKGGAGPSRESRVGPRNRGGRHVQIANGPSGSFPLQETDKWYKILIPYGGKYEKTYVLSTLLNYVSPNVFVPIAYRASNNEASFYVDDYKAARTLAMANKKITTNDGFKLIVKAFPGCPNISVDEERYKQKILAAMRGRFNAETKALDLRKFHTDPNLVDDLLVATFRPRVLTVIVGLIAENIPELVGLNLDENQLYTLEPLVALAKKTPNLSVLHLGKNKIRDLRGLECLKSLKLVELYLNGNPLCNKFSEESVYISEVRKIFPKVIRLDGTELPPPIVFDVSEEVKLPPFLTSFVCSPEGQQVAKQFLELYFLIYDSADRNKIADAYHENAQFSLSLTLPKGDGNHKLGHYMVENRNLLRIKDANRRLKLLVNGKTNIVSKLKDLPETKHDLVSFTVDLPIFSAQLMFLNISGVFIETKMLHMPTRFFSRTFVIVPLGSGYVIINDLLNITNASSKQAKEAFTKTLEITPAATPVASPVASPSVGASPVAVVPDEVKEQMVVAMCQHTSMNPLWSKKCLEENCWDFKTAVAVFSQLHRDQKVPPEAFVQ